MTDGDEAVTKTPDIAELRRKLEGLEPHKDEIIVDAVRRGVPGWDDIAALLDSYPALLDRWEAAERVAKKLESMVEFGDLIEEFDDMLEIAALLRGKENEA